MKTLSDYTLNHLNKNALIKIIKELYAIRDEAIEYIEQLLREEFEITDVDNINFGEKCQRAYFSDSELGNVIDILQGNKEK